MIGYVSKKCYRIPFPDSLLDEMLKSFDPKEASKLTSEEDEIESMQNVFEVDMSSEVVECNNTYKRVKKYYIDFLLSKSRRPRGKSSSSSRALSEEEKKYIIPLFKNLGHELGVEFDFDKIRYVEFEYFCDDINVPDVYDLVV